MTGASIATALPPRLPPRRLAVAQRQPEKHGRIAVRHVGRLASRHLLARLAYLRRLQLDVEPPSVAALHRLVEAQTRHVPYETVWLYLGDRRGISPGESLRHVVAERRGGYCYQLNGAFCWLLRQLGYHAMLHRSSVHGPEAPAPVQWLNHAALLVHDLPDETNPAGTWFADVGLGDGPNASRPAGRRRPPTSRRSVESSPRRRHDSFDSRCIHGPRGSFNRVGIGDPVTSMRPFVARHRWLSTSPDSSFRRAVVVQRRDGPDVVTCAGCCSRASAADRARRRRSNDRARGSTCSPTSSAWSLDEQVQRARVERLWRHVSAPARVAGSPPSPRLTSASARSYRSMSSAPMFGELPAHLVGGDHLDHLPPSGELLRDHLVDGVPISTSTRPSSCSATT